MKKIFISLLALISLVALQLPANQALAAPSIRIFKAATGEEGVSSFSVPKDAGKSSWPVYLALSEAPAKPVTLQVKHQGAAVFYWSGSNDLTFNKDDWSRRRRLVLEYQGNAQPGTMGRITISGNGLASREILFTVEGGSDTNGDNGNNGNGSGTGGTGGGDPTKLAENITTDDLKGLGFADLTVDGAFDRIIQLMLILIALGAFLSIMYSGYQYITSGGDATVATKARRNITWAVIGILIALFAFAAVRYVAGIGERGSLVQIPDAANNNTNTNNNNQNTNTTGSTSDLNGVSILIFDSSNFSPSTIVLPDATTQLSEQLALQLSAPAGNMTVTATTTGNLPVTVVPATFTFNDQNWQQSQLFGISYAGNGQSGQAAEVILKTSTGAKYVIRVEVP